MKRKRRTLQPASIKVLSDTEAQAIDALYGLEPVIELEKGGNDAGAPTQLTHISCPYCGENYVTCIDLSNGASVYIEDCQVCCQPMELTIALDDVGALQSVQARRLD